MGGSASSKLWMACKGRVTTALPTRAASALHGACCSVGVSRFCRRVLRLGEEEEVGMRGVVLILFDDDEEGDSEVLLLLVFLFLRVRFGGMSLDGNE